METAGFLEIPSPEVIKAETKVKEKRLRKHVLKLKAASDPISFTTLKLQKAESLKLHKCSCWKRYNRAIIQRQKVIAVK